MEKSLEGSIIPDDVVWDILSRLPPETLIKFRSVSKSWYHQIADQNFIHKQASTYGQLCSGNEKEDYVPFGIEFPNPIPIIMGTCNILCCCRNPTTLRLCLYNPYIRKAVVLPPDTLSGYVRWPYGAGLCYEESTRDFKVVKIESENNGSISFAIYSLNENLWGRKNNVVLPGLRRLEFYMPSICLNGIIYWCSMTTILSFDLSRQTFRQIPCPPEAQSLNSCICFLSVVKGSICLVEDIGIESGALSLWTLKEGGIMRWKRKSQNYSDGRIRTEDGVIMRWKRKSHKYSDGRIRIPWGVNLQGKCFVTKTKVKEFSEVMLYDLETKEEEYFCRISGPTVVRNLMGMRGKGLHLLNREGEYLFID